MAVQNALASVAVKDLQAVQAWYEKLLDSPATQPMDGLAEWHFDGGGGLQVYQLPERAGSCSATLAVDDFDAQIAKLKQLKIYAQHVSSDRAKVAMIKDPDGNSIAIAQALDPSLAH